MTAFTDEVVAGILTGPYLLLVLLAGYMWVLRRRIKRLERKADMENIQWRER